MAHRIQSTVFVTIQTMFLAWAIFGFVAMVQAEGLGGEDEARSELFPKATYIAPGRRQLSEPARRENLGVCFLGCSLTPLLPNCCFGLCVDLLINPLNCGTCGKVCLFPTPICCGGVCTNTLIDPKNCGFCGHSCGPKKCIGGFCNYNG